MTLISTAARRAASRWRRIGSLAALLLVGSLARAETATTPPASAATTPAPVAAPAAAHPEVARAIAYTLPAPQCSPPDMRRATHNAGWMERNERASKRYIKCLEGYQVGLFQDFQFLRDSVRHGATIEQARTIAGNMGKVAEAIKALRGRGVSLAQDQARVISSGLSGNRTMPGAENR